MKFAVPLLIALAVCNTASADLTSKFEPFLRAKAPHQFTGLAQRIIASIDACKRAVKPYSKWKPPAGASSEVKRACEKLNRAAKRFCWKCDAVIRRAERVEGGNESAKALEGLRDSLHDLQMAANKFREAKDAVTRAVQEF